MGLFAHKRTHIVGASLILLTVFAMLYLSHATLKSNLRHPVLMVDVVKSPNTRFKVYWDTGSGWNEKESASKSITGTYKSQPLRIQLPRRIQGLRIDPSEIGDAQEMHIRIGWFRKWTSLNLFPEMIAASHQIERVEQGQDGQLLFSFEQGCNDPHFVIKEIPELLQSLEAKRIHLLTTFRILAGFVAAAAALVALFSIRKP